MKEQKYYWLKLQSDFFKRHDIRVIEAMPNGKDYVLFYLKLLCESITHEGRLRFSEVIPYNEEMLATITSTNVDVVKTAVQIFTSLGLMEIMNDGTYYFNEVNKMIGYASDNPNANRVRKFRENQKMQALQNVTDSITKCNGDIEIEKELDIDIDLKRNIKEKDENDSDLDFLSNIPTLQEVKDYCTLKSYKFDVEYFYNYYSATNWKRNGQPIENWQAVANQWGRRENMQQGFKDMADVVVKPKRIESEFEPRKYSQEEIDQIFNNTDINDDEI